MLHGAPGVGKYTVGQELAKLTGFPLFHNHLTVDLLANVFDFATTPFVELRDEIWLRVIGRAAEEELPGLIFTLVYEPTLLPRFTERLRETLAENNAELLPFELRCDLEENLRRVQQPDRKRFLKMTDPAPLRDWVLAGDYAVQGELPGNIVVDVTSRSSADTARLIAARIWL